MSLVRESTEPCCDCVGLDCVVAGNDVRHHMTQLDGHLPMHPDHTTLSKTEGLSMT
jgi:hypothetical protein